MSSANDTVSTARARYLRGSPTKFRLVADAIRGKSVSDALGILQLSGRRASQPLEKVVRSAIANAEDRAPDVDVDRLYVSEIFIDPGPSLPPRIRPQPMGRAYPIIKRTSHVTVKLAEREA
jgi:large subunit ribosomal protein L22